MKRRFSVAIVGAFAVAVCATAARAQVGAIGGAPGSAITGSESQARAPVFIQSGLIAPAKSWSLSAFSGYTSGGVDFGFDQVDFSFTQLLLGGTYSPTEKVTLGAFVFPYNRVSAESNVASADDSGMGDAELSAKLSLLSSEDGKTALAAIGSVGLPIGDEDFGSSGVSFSAGAGITHTLERVTLHAAAGVLIPTDDADGETTVKFGGALTYGASPKLSLGVEVLGSTASVEGQRYTSIDGAPTLRLRLGQRAFLDGGVLFNLSTSPGESPFDYAAVVGFTITR
jgi:hypothetical protein